MRRIFLYSSVLALTLPLQAQAASNQDEAHKADENKAKSGSPATTTPADMIFTGVAKGRDRLDSAVSTSSLRLENVERLGARNIGQILHSVAGIRAGDTLGDGNADITVRGLPLTSSGAKYLQLQEDGLPVLEFGDIIGGTSDLLLRFDMNVAQVEAIRGGSASTFASNSPAGIINFISRTGTGRGGTIQASTGLNYKETRFDFEYGQPIDEKTRFHFGGYWHRGAGPRYTGYDDAVQGGQFKFNLTRELPNGYVRFYGKWLDDRAPIYIGTVMRLSGTDAAPVYSPLPDTDPRRDTIISRQTGSLPQLDQNGRVVTDELRKGQRGISRAVGLEGNIELGGWNITERFRYARNSTELLATMPMMAAPAADFAGMFGATSLAFASGPRAGVAITNAAAQLGADGVLAMNDLTAQNGNKLHNITNDLRASRVWNLGGGELTATGGVYAARQAYKVAWTTTDYVTSVTGRGTNVMVDLIGPAGPITERGVYAYSDPLFTFQGTRVMDVDYDVNAGFGSLNFRKGKVAIGGSLRYDFGGGRGRIWGSELAPGGAGYGYYPIIPGSTADAASTVAISPLSWSMPVNYRYHYLSYSTGINYRVAEPFSLFARYSQGGRANSDRMLFTSLLNPVTGGLAVAEGVVGKVKQAEAGLKLRSGNNLLNVTGFWAKTRDYDTFFGPLTIRDYTAYGLEVEGELREGPWAISANATYTHARITRDYTQSGNNGRIPPMQPTWIVNLVPHYDAKLFSVGGYVFFNSKRYASVSNELVMPAYLTVNPYLQLRPTNRLSLMLNAYNLFNVMGITSMFVPNMASANSGYAPGTTIQGRTVTASVKMTF